MSAITVTILSNGAPIPGEIQLISVETRWEANRIPSASMTLLDGDVALQKFEVSNSAIFELGREIEIKARYEGNTEGDATLFKGMVIRHALEADEAGMRLRVELKDKAFGLSMGRHSRTFAKMKDSAVFAQLLRQAGLRTGRVEDTKYQQEQVVQYACSDWDFLVTRAELNGLVVVVEGGALSIVPPKAKGPKKLSIELGITEVHDMAMEIDGTRQFKGFLARGWDEKRLATMESNRPNNPPTQQGKKPKGAQIAAAFGIKECVLRHVVPSLKPELEAWAAGMVERSGLSLIRGRMSIPGQGKVKLLDGIEILGVGDRFNGETFITGLHHRIENGNWTMDIHFGLPWRRLCEDTDVGDLPAGGALPAVRGLQIGLITKMNDDPERLGRVKVALPALTDASEQVWARMLFPEAGKGRGWFFMPEIGDEVLVGFLNDDPRQPVVLGSLFGSKNTAPSDFANPTDKNLVKGIMTRGGTKFIFRDADKPSVSIETKGGNKVVLDDDAKKIEIIDLNGNKLVLDDKGITVKTSKKLLLDAGGEVEIKGSKVDVK